MCTAICITLQMSDGCCTYVCEITHSHCGWYTRKHDVLNSIIIICAAYTYTTYKPVQKWRPFPRTTGFCVFQFCLAIRKQPLTFRFYWSEACLEAVCVYVCRGDGVESRILDVQTSFSTDVFEFSKKVLHNNSNRTIVPTHMSANIRLDRSTAIATKQYY